MYLAKLPNEFSHYSNADEFKSIFQMIHRSQCTFRVLLSLKFRALSPASRLLIMSRSTTGIMFYFSGSFNAFEYGNSCLGYIDEVFGDFPGSDMWNPKTPLSEDCLNLNVWGTTTKARKKSCACKLGNPFSKIVLELDRGNNKFLRFEIFVKLSQVWIFGGGFFSGSSSLWVYDPKALATHSDIIVVSMNYRLLSFGFLTTGDKRIKGMNLHVTCNISVSDDKMFQLYLSKFLSFIPTSFWLQHVMQPNLTSHWSHDIICHILLIHIIMFIHFIFNIWIVKFIFLQFPIKISKTHFFFSLSISLSAQLFWLLVVKLLMWPVTSCTLFHNHQNIHV